MCFVDYEKAFDRVNWVKLLKLLKRIGIDWRDRRLIATLYMGQTATVRLKDGLTNPAIIGRGTRQGCCLSPLLFNIYAEAMLREALDQVDEGIRVGGHLIKTVRYADDQATVASSANGLQLMMDNMQETAREYGMKINAKKTKVMKISKQPGEQLAVHLDGKPLSQVKRFCYLGSTLTQEGYCDVEIKTRIARAKDAFSKRKELMTKSFSLILKKRIIKAVVWSTLLYGSESWTLRKDKIRRIESCEMWMWRKTLNIQWSEKVSNEEVLRRVGEERSLLDTIRRRQKTWLGHTIRHGDLLVIVMEGRIEGKRPPGRKRCGMMDQVKRQAGSYERVKRLSENRFL